ncbi:MAG TPA: hypothetical protein VLK84_15590, partial [Longimicrobium sp.]|nr:hypothetical protein [Longimicrobium sp.]
MSIHPYHARGRVPGVLLAAGAVCLLAGCEAARVAQPQATPTPAEHVAAAAATLGLPRGAVDGPASALAARVQGWDTPLAPSKGEARPVLDAATAEDVARRGER